jgi:hypothetical protein
LPPNIPVVDSAGSYWPGLGVLHLDIEITTIVEDARIGELVLQFMP